MRFIAASFAVVLAFQRGPARPDFSRLIPRPRACVPTAPMPIIGLRSRPPEPMPVARPDSTKRDSSMVIRVVPCYLVDTLSRPRR